MDKEDDHQRAGCATKAERRTQQSLSPQGSALHNFRLLLVLKTGEASLALCLPTIVLFWHSYGLSVADVMLLQAVYAVTSAFAEIPCGYIADRTARVRTLQLAQLFFLAGIAIYCVADNFSAFLLAEVLFAFATAANSGSDQALLFDSLKDEGLEVRFSTLWGRMWSVMVASTAVFFLAGGWIGVEFSPRHAFYVLGALFIGTSVVAIFLREPARAVVEPQHDRSAWKDLLHIGRDTLIHRRDQRWIILMSALLFSVGQCAFWLFQPYLMENGLSESLNGPMYFSAALVAVGLGKAVEVARGRWSSSTVIAVALGVLVCSLTGAFLAPLWGAALLGAFYLHWSQLQRIVCHVELAHLLNLATTSDRRATVLSVRQMVSVAAYAGLLLVVGDLAERWGAGVTLLLLGGGAAFTGAALLWVRGPACGLVAASDTMQSAAPADCDEPAICPSVNAS